MSNRIGFALGSRSRRLALLAGVSVLGLLVSALLAPCLALANSSLPPEEKWSLYLRATGDTLSIGAVIVLLLACIALFGLRAIAHASARAAGTRPDEPPE